jgi:hypothetical protein
MLNFIGAANKNVYAIAIDDPRIHYVDDGPGGGQKIIKQSGVEYIAIPYDTSVKTLQISGIKSVSKSYKKTIDLSLPIKNMQELRN